MTKRERRLSWGLLLTFIGAVIFLCIISDRVIPIPLDIIKPSVSVAPVNPNADIAPQQPLADPPPVVKAIYATNWSAASEKKVNYFLDLLNTTELNAIVIDIKDYTGIVGYGTDAPLVKQYGTWERRIPKINALIKKFHDAGVYVIGRIAVFQDDALVEKRPDLALHASSTGAIWGDRKGVHWLDETNQEVWQYNAQIAQDAVSRGFDEINFDYVRFPTDGDTADIKFPPAALGLAGKQAILHQFFSYMRNQLDGARLSADLFGEVTYTDESPIGQRLSNTFESFDDIAPMIYPSHFNPQFLGLKNAAANPYPVIRYALDSALRHESQYEDGLAASHGTSTQDVALPQLATFRPWLQDFNLGATYTAAMVRAQITAVDDSARAAAGCPGIPVTSSEHQVVSEPTGPRAQCDYQPIGWMLWNPANVYTKAALMPQ